MEADELAAAHHEPRVIASALVAVAASSVAASSVGASTTVLDLVSAADRRAPAVAPWRAVADWVVRLRSAGQRTVGGGASRAQVSAGGSEALARVQRLLHPPARLPAVRRALARTGIAALTVAPLLLAAAPIAVALA